MMMMISHSFSQETKIVEEIKTHDVRNNLKKMGGDELETKDAGEEEMERNN